MQQEIPSSNLPSIEALCGSVKELETRYESALNELPAHSDLLDLNYVKARRKVALELDAHERQLGRLTSFLNFHKVKVVGNSDETAKIEAALRSLEALNVKISNSKKRIDGSKQLIVDVNKKGMQYFANLYGRNIKGWFKWWGSAFIHAIKNPPILIFMLVGLPFTLCTAVLVVVLSPITSFIKSAIDYASRKVPAKDKRYLFRSTTEDGILPIEEKITSLTDKQHNDVVSTITLYRKKYFLSTMSESTRMLKRALMNPSMDRSINVPSQTKAQLIASEKALIIEYMTKEKNYAKGLFNKVLDAVSDPDHIILPPASLTS